jgi:PKD repeat protein
VTECWETATFDNTTCAWVVTGTQAPAPVTECWESATFDNVTCAWVVTGVQDPEPVTECWETATFDNATCAWVVTGTQDPEPVTECWETATFNTATCAWVVTGVQANSVLTENACGSYTSPDGFTYNASGVYIAVLTDDSGCDSIVNINLTVLPDVTSTISQTICSGSQVEGYTMTGVYTDVFQAANGCDSTRTLDLTVLPAPIAAFSINDICEGDSALFLNTSAVSDSSPVEWLWEFGNGSQSDLLNPDVQSYPESGSYGVSLSMTYANGCQSIAVDTIHVYPNPAVTVQWENACTGIPAQFLGLVDSISSGTELQWLWVFSDGQVSSLQSPSMEFTQPGDFGFSLTVTTPYGCKGSATVDEFTIHPTPVAGFISETSFCEGEEMEFINSSSVNEVAGDEIATWSYSIGDLYSSNEPDISVLAEIPEAVAHARVVEFCS